VGNRSVFLTADFCENERIFLPEDFSIIGPKIPPETSFKREKCHFFCGWLLQRSLSLIIFSSKIERFTHRFVTTVSAFMKTTYEDLFAELFEDHHNATTANKSPVKNSYPAVPSSTTKVSSDQSKRSANKHSQQSNTNLQDVTWSIDSTKKFVVTKVSETTDFMDGKLFYHDFVQIESHSHNLPAEEKPIIDYTSLEALEAELFDQYLEMNRVDS
jgi:hypothetical protein